MATTAVAFWLRVALTPWVGDRPLLILFVIPLVLTAYVGGLGPGLFCTALVGLLTAFYFMPPTHSFAFERPLDFAQWLLLVMIGAMISLLIADLHRVKGGTVIDPSQGNYVSTERKVQTGFALALALLATIGAVSYLSVVNLTDNAARITRSHEVSNGLDRLLLAATEAESMQRGYVLSGDASYLDS